MRHVCALTFFAVFGAATFASPSYGAQVVGLGGKCLDVRDGGTANHTPVQMWTCVPGNPNQEWVYDNGELIGIGGKCLDVPSGSRENGVRLQTYDCHGGPNQRWSLTNGQLVVLGGKCLDVTEGDTDDGTPVQTWDCVAGNPNQLWSISGARGASGVFANPSYNGYRLDWCRTFENDCGAPAAAAFCQAQGFGGFNRFRRQSGMNVMTMTVGQNSVCDPRWHGCDSFAFIACR